MSDMIRPRPRRLKGDPAYPNPLTVWDIRLWNLGKTMNYASTRIVNDRFLVIHGFPTLERNEMIFVVDLKTGNRLFQQRIRGTWQNPEPITDGTDLGAYLD